MGTKTANYQLNQWEPEDDFLRTDFNEDNAKIDAALREIRTAIPNIVLGSYTGDGAAQQDIALGGQPRFILVWQTGISVLATDYYAYWGMTIGDAPTALVGTKTVQLTESGFRVFLKTMSNTYHVNTNTANAEYYYLAIM